MKNTIFLLSVLLSAAITQATSSFAKEKNTSIAVGVEAGMNLFNATHPSVYINQGRVFGYKTGITAGIPVQANLSPRFGIRTGAYYSAKGFNNQRLYSPFGEEPIITNIRLHYLEVPLSAVFKFGKSKKMYAGGGGYLAYAVDGDGRLLNTSKEYKLLFGNSSYFFESYSRLDYGAQVLGGVALPRGFFAQLQISKGLANIQGENAGADTYKNFGATISAGWMIGSVGVKERTNAVL